MWQLLQSYCSSLWCLNCVFCKMTQIRKHKQAILSLRTSISVSCSFSHYAFLYPFTHSFLLFVSLFPSLPPSLPVSSCHPPPSSTSNTGQIGKPWWRHRSWGRSYLSQTDQEVCDGGVDGCCRSVTLAGARQAGPHGSGTVGLQTDGTWWVTNN